MHPLYGSFRANAVQNGICICKQVQKRERDWSCYFMQYSVSIIVNDNMGRKLMNIFYSSDDNVGAVSRKKKGQRWKH